MYSSLFYFILVKYIYRENLSLICLFVSIHTPNPNSLIFFISIVVEINLIAMKENK